MVSPFYNSAYNTAVNLLNVPFKDMRNTPESTILTAVRNARAALSNQGHRLTEQDCDNMLTELLEAQQQAKTTGSGKVSSRSWQWSEKPQPRESLLSHHSVRDY